MGEMMIRLAFLRKQQRLSQAELAERLACGRNTLSLLENRHRGPDNVSGLLARALETHFGEPLDVLLSPLEVVKPKRQGRNGGER